MTPVPTGYPAHLAHEHTLHDGRVIVVRPIRPDDEDAERAFFSALSPEARHRRFMKYVGSVGDRLIHFFTHIDYAFHMAFVCEARVEGKAQLVGEARYVGNPDGASCEFGIVIADAWHGSGIAGLLMLALIDAARLNGFKTMEGLVLRENRTMCKFVKALGFEVASALEDPTTVRAVKRLAPDLRQINRP